MKKEKIENTGAIEPENTEPANTGKVVVKSVAEAVLVYVTRHNDATAETVAAFLEKIGMAAAPATINSQLNAARKKLGLTKERVAGPTEEIKAIFESGKRTAAEVIAQLEADGVSFKESTVKAQVTKLRKEAGLGRKTISIELD
jgi:predicted transcriptional regulator